jgi:hypothetical protein
VERSSALRSQTTEACTALSNSTIQLTCFKLLKNLEDAALPARLQQVCLHTTINPLLSGALPFLFVFRLNESTEKLRIEKVGFKRYMRIFKISAVLSVSFYTMEVVPLIRKRRWLCHQIKMRFLLRVRIFLVEYNTA